MNLVAKEFEIDYRWLFSDGGNGLACNYMVSFHVGVAVYAAP